MEPRIPLSPLLKMHSILSFGVLLCKTPHQVDEGFETRPNKHARHRACFGAIAYIYSINFYFFRHFQVVIFLNQKIPF